MLFVASVAGIETDRGLGGREKGMGLGRRVRDACCKNHILSGAYLFTSADVGCRKFLFG